MDESQRLRLAGKRFGERQGVYQLNQALDPHAIVATLGGAICIRGYTSNRLLTVRSPGNFTVEIHRNTSASRNNFAMAQALGHYQLHYMNILDLLPHQNEDLPQIEFVFEDESKERPRMMHEARLFARGLLTSGIDLRSVDATNSRSLAYRLHIPRTILGQEIELAQRSTQLE